MQKLQGEKIEYKGKSYRVQNAKGWKHIIVKKDGKRQLIGLSQIEQEQLHGQTSPVWFGYIFEGGFEKGSNPYYDKLLRV